MFEWQKFSQDSCDVPHYQKLLEFLNLRAQASEASSEASSERKKGSRGDRKNPPGRHITSFAANATDQPDACVLCKTDRHPLYLCQQFKTLPHDKMISTLKSNNICLNCLRPGHFLKQCKSLNRCRKCQKPHHTLLHVDLKDNVPAHLQGPLALLFLPMLLQV